MKRLFAFKTVELLVVILLSWLCACGIIEKKEKSSANSDVLEFERKYFDFPEDFDQKLNKLQNLAEEYVSDPYNLRKLKQIQRLIEGMKLPGKGAGILETIESLDGRHSPLSLILSKYYLKKNLPEKAMQFFRREPFRELVGFEEASDFLLELDVLGELLPCIMGENKKYSEEVNVISGKEVYGRRVRKTGVRDFFQENYPGAFIDEGEKYLLIDFSHLKEVIEVKKTILKCSKNVRLRAPHVHFDLVSGIQTTGGMSITIEAGYLQNGIFMTTDKRKVPRALDGKKGQNARVMGRLRNSRSSPPLEGEKGKGGRCGENGGNIQISSVISANSLCGLDLCRTILTANGSIGQVGGNGGKGGNGLSTWGDGPDISPGPRIFDRISWIGRASLRYWTRKINPAGGGEPGQGGDGGQPGKIIIQGAGFAVNTLIRYSRKGPRGKNGARGKPGDMIHE